MDNILAALGERLVWLGCGAVIGLLVERRWHVCDRLLSALEALPWQTSARS